MNLSISKSRFPSIFFIYCFSLLPILATAQAAWTKTFVPDTIGLGSVSTLTFTFTNNSGNPISNISFTDILPAGVQIATPANAFTACDGIINVSNGGNTITYSGGRVGNGQSCTLTVDVTSSIIGVHTNVTGILSSSAGTTSSVTDNLIVDANRPGFSKIFAPTSVEIGERTGLTFTINNTNNPSIAASLAFVDNLPEGMVIASPANATTTCPSATITAVAGSSSISLGGTGTVAANSTCEVSVDVVSSASGTLENTSDALTSVVNSTTISSGKASALLEVKSQTLGLTKSFTDDPVPAGGTVELAFNMINRDRNNSATDLSFTDNLAATLAGLTFSSLISNNCGGTVGGVGTSSINFSGGTLASGASCSCKVVLAIPPDAAPSNYTNSTSAITGMIGGISTTGNIASDDLFVAPVSKLTKKFLNASTMLPNPVVNAGDDIIIRFTIENSSTTSGATAISFIDDLTAFLPFPITASLPASGFCGAGSAISIDSLGEERQGLSVTGANLTAAPGTGATCSFDVTLTLPDDLPIGTYTNTTEAITAMVNGAVRTGPPASDDFEVIAAPTLSKSFKGGPFAPGGTATLEFTLSYSANATSDATNITFTDDLAAGLAGMTATLPPTPNPPCGAGSSLTANAGNTLITFAGGTLSPGETCTFSVIVNIPSSTTIGAYTNSTSPVSATVNSVSATNQPATADISIIGMTFNKEFISNPVFPGDITTLRFSINNFSPNEDATNIVFSDDLRPVLSGLVATGSPTVNTCGGNLGGTDFLTYTGGTLTAGQSCLVEVPLLVPASATAGSYTSTSENFFAIQGGGLKVFDKLTDILEVSTTLLALTKEFTDDPILIGGTGNLKFTIKNLSDTKSISDITFSDNLNAALIGLSATPIANGFCGASSTMTGSGNLIISNASVAAGQTCEFTVPIAVPANAVPGVYTNTTNQITGMVGSVPVTGNMTAAQLTTIGASFTKSFNGPTIKNGTPVLRFTINNLSPTQSVLNLAFTDDLNAVLNGLVATGLPLTDICGNGSMVSGTSTLSFTGGQIQPSGTCIIDVPLQVPANAPIGFYSNTTSELTTNGTKIADPASANLEIKPVTFIDKVFSPNTICQDTISTLIFSINNTASAIAATNLSFNDHLPAGLVVAATPNVSTNCIGGIITAVAGSSVISFSGDTVAAGGTCVIRIDVMATSAGNKINTSGILTSSNGDGGTATDTLTVNASPTISGITTVCENETSMLSSNTTPDESMPWTSSNPSVATISNSGLVTSHAIGSSVITFKDNNGCTSVVTFTVNSTSTSDSDNDSVPDCMDICPGGDDKVNTDGLGMPDACDCNPNDPTDEFVRKDGIIVAGDYQSSFELKSKGMIKDGTVNFIAGNRIILEPGFEVKIGNSFSATIQRCEGTNAAIGELDQTKWNDSNVSEIEATTLTIMPNPFTNSFRVAYTIEKPGQVDIRLYNQSGQLIKHIQQNQFSTAGKHQIQVNTSDLPQGLYLIGLFVDGKVITKRGILSK